MPACPKPPTRYQQKADAAKTLAAHEREVWHAVDVRDGCACRVCGTFCAPRAIGMLHRPHRHHLVYRKPRGGKPSGETTSGNLVTLCASCHDAEHRHELRLTGDADWRDELGRLAGVKVERVGESGWTVEKFV